jgi:AcrR family transcriptional regulator
VSGLTGDHILTAAAKAFDAKGYAGTTMKDIAGEVGCTAPAIYGHFENKLAVFEAITERTRIALLEAIDTPCSHNLPAAVQLELLLVRQFEVAERYRTDMSVFFALRSSGVPARSKRRAEGPRGLDLYCEVLERWLVATFGAATLAPCSPRMAAFALAGLVTSLFRMWLAGPEEERLVPLAPIVRGLFLQGIEGLGHSDGGQAT